MKFKPLISSIREEKGKEQISPHTPLHSKLVALQIQNETKLYQIHLFTYLVFVLCWWWFSVCRLLMATRSLLSISPHVTETFWELLKLFRYVLDWHNNGSGDMAERKRKRKIIIFSPSKSLFKATNCVNVLWFYWRPHTLFFPLGKWKFADKK